jgi:PST family polysaccharide transporter
MADTSYKNIFKTTFLFGFVQVARLLVSVVKNKVIAILLGPQGIGILSIFNSSTELIKTGAGLGISQSAVKDVAEANASNDRYSFSKTITVTNRAVIYTSLLGLIITVLFSPLLSRWGFSDLNHTWSFVLLSIAVFFEIFANNQMAILKGMRMLRVLAKVSLFGSIVAVVLGLPTIYLWGEKGIVSSIILSSLSMALYSAYYVRKIDYERIHLKIKEFIKSASSMLKMGISLMMSNFVAFFSNLLIIGYIQKVGGLSDVGFFNAGTVLVVSYFSMVTTALNTDYYPRISAKCSDNCALSGELFRQSLVGLLLVQPLVIVFVILAPIAIRILYTPEFITVLDYTDIAIVGTLISVVSNCLGYILIAKQEARLYLIISVLFAVLIVPLYIVFYHFWGLKGLGIAYTINVLAQLIVYAFYCWRKYGIVLKREIWTDLLFIIILIIISVYLRRSGTFLIQVVGVLILFAMTALFLFYNIKYKMGVDLRTLMKRFSKKDRNYENSNDHSHEE